MELIAIIAWFFGIWFAVSIVLATLFCIVVKIDRKLLERKWRNDRS